MTEEAAKTNRQSFEALATSMMKLSTAMAEMARRTNDCESEQTWKTNSRRWLERLYKIDRRTQGDDCELKQTSQKVEDNSSIEDEPFYQSSHGSQRDAEFPSGESSKEIDDLTPNSKPAVVDDAQEVNKAFTVEDHLDNIIPVFNDDQLGGVLNARCTPFVIAPDNVVFIIRPVGALPHNAMTFCHHSLPSLFGKVFQKPETWEEYIIYSRSALLVFLRQLNFVTVRQKVHIRKEIKEFVKDYGFLGLMGRGTLYAEQVPKVSLEGKGNFEGRGNVEIQFM